MSIFDVLDEDFEEKVIQKSKEKPVLVDFWADWCMPCKQLSPIIDTVAEDLEDKIELAELNVDKAKETATKYGVRSIPTVKLFKDGEVEDEFIGAKPEGKVKEWLEKRL